MVIVVSSIDYTDPMVNESIMILHIKMELYGFNYYLFTYSIISINRHDYIEYIDDDDDDDDNDNGDSNINQENGILFDGSVERIVGDTHTQRERDVQSK